MEACYNGHKDVVQLLLENSERNIDFNARNLLEWTAFISACKKFDAIHFGKNGLKDVIKLLVQHSKTKGIDISIGQEDISDEMRLFIASLQ